MPILPTGPSQVTKTGNVGSVDVFRASRLFTNYPSVQGNALRGSWMVSKNPQKIREANVMPSLPIVHTHFALRRNVGSLDAPRVSQLFTFGPRGQGVALRGS